MDFGVKRISDGGVILLAAVPLGSNGSQATSESLAQPWAQALVVPPLSTHRLASQPGDGKTSPFGILCGQLLILPNVEMSDAFSH